MHTDKYMILIIEDEADLLELMEYNFQKAGFDTIGFLSTKSVEQFLKEEPVDLMIVDRNLHGVEGSEFVEYLRNKGNQTPVIYVTAKYSPREIEEGFLSGGDDYITKPFNMNELILRVHAVLKRSKPSSSQMLCYRDICLYLHTRKATVAKAEIELTKLEFEALLLLGL